MVIFDLDSRRSRLKDLEVASSQPNLWDDPQKAQETLQQVARLREDIEPWEQLQNKVEELLGLIELTADADAEEVEELAQEIERDTAAAQNQFDLLHFEALFNGEHDHNNAIISINAGAGGTEAADWAQMLSRMYSRWAQTRGYEVEVIEESPAEEAGLKSWTAMVSGHNAYGYLKAERGVHRLIRLSPYDANHKRHTSFASVDVIPESGEEAHLQINPDELKIESYRSSGPGGQHAQKNETAIRITHVPTGLSAQSQNQRSQMRNREMAMKVLEARLVELMRQQKQQELAKLRGAQKDIAWGSQIRSYVFHPYNMVKDHRTDHETSNVEAVMDGDLDGLMRAYLEQTSGDADRGQLSQV